MDYYYEYANWISFGNSLNLVNCSDEIREIRRLKMEITSSKTFNLLDLTLQELCILEEALGNAVFAEEENKDCGDILCRQIRSARESIR
jgi:hypothetical protein